MILKLILMLLIFQKQKKNLKKKKIKKKKRKKGGKINKWEKIKICYSRTEKDPISPKTKIKFLNKNGLVASLCKVYASIVGCTFIFSKMN